MKLRNKLFLLTLSIFGFLLSLEFIIGKYYLDDIYEYIKKREINNVFNKINTKPTKDKIDYYEKNLNSKIFYLNDNININQLNYLKVEVDNEYIYIILDNLIDDFHKKELFQNGNHIEFRGINFYSNYYIPIVIGDYIDYEMEGITANEKIYYFQGKITKSNIHNEEADEFIELIASYKDKILAKEEFDKVITEVDGDKYYIGGRRVEDDYLLIFYNFAPIKDTLDIFARFLFYIFVLSLILITITTFIWTSYLTRFISELIIKVKAMASLDFSKKIDEDRRDELGKLGYYINNLGEKLEGTLEALDKELDKKEKEKEIIRTLLSNLSHEFKTPLTLISGYTEVLKLEGENEYLDIIESECERLGKLIDKSLYAMKLESSIGLIEKEDVNLSSLVDEILETFSLEIKDFELLKNINKDIYLSCDKVMIEQVIYNLLSNSIKHSKGKLVVEVGNNNGKVEVVIGNNGEKLGEEKDKIWEKFYRGKNQKRGGIGLGLYIVSNIVKGHMGEIRVEETKDFTLFKIIF